MNYNMLNLTINVVEQPVLFDQSAILIYGVGIGSVGIVILLAYKLRPKRNLLLKGLH